jgi:hypothetical protein
MRVYHYMETKWARQALKDNRLKLARVLDMNDPFEFMAHYSADAGKMKALESFRVKFNELWGYLCFSPSWQSCLMWSHYAEKQKGVVLGFEVEDQLLTKVNYIPERPIFETLEEKSQGLTNLTYAAEYMSKHEGWAYEDEYRYAAKLSDAVQETHENKVLYFELFGEALELVEVLVGPNSEQGCDGMLDALAAGGHEIEPILTHLAPDRFELDR